MLQTEYQVLALTQTLNLSSSAFSGNNHQSDETISLDNRELVLTKRIHEADTRVPIPYTGWSIRQKGFGEGDLASLSGMFIPFAKTKQERIMSGDPRLSLEERYGNHEGYVSAVRKAAEELVKSGFLLPEDAQNEITKAEQSKTLNSR